MDATDRLIQEYTETRTAYELELAAMLHARDEAIKPVQADIDAIAAEFAPRIAAADEKLRTLEAQLKAAVIAAGQTFKGRRWEFRFSSGKRTVPVNDLEALAKVKGDPTLLNIIKTGEPSVAIHEVKS